MLLEMFVSCALLGVLLVICLEMVAAMAAQRRTADQRQMAVIEVGNVMERLAARGFDDLTPRTVAAERLPAAVAEKLPGAELKVEVSNGSADPAAKRIVVALRWKDRAGVLLPPVRLVTWKWKNETVGKR
jgi:hypothetical protein